MGMFRTEQLTT